MGVEKPTDEARPSRDRRWYMLGMRYGEGIRSVADRPSMKNQADRIDEIEESFASADDDARSSHAPQLGHYHLSRNRFGL
jgi:hypothetical protein